MAIEFTKALETGNDLIDSEHRELIKAINALMDACSAGKGRTVVDKIVRYVYAYTAKHFSDEEALQKRYGYPDYPQHRQYHEGFKRVVKEIAKRLHYEGPTIELIGQVNKNIAGWLVNHIRTEDVKVAAHVRSKT